MIGTHHLDARLSSFDHSMARETRLPVTSRGCQSNSLLQLHKGIILRSGRRSAQTAKRCMLFSIGFGQSMAINVSATLSLSATMTEETQALLRSRCCMIKTEQLVFGL